MDQPGPPFSLRCDYGVLDYWIKAQNLAALRFDRVVAKAAEGAGPARPWVNNS